MKKTEVTKNLIIDSAIKLLRKNGCVTIKEISEDAGVNIAAVNYHFTDKSTLMAVVVRRVLSDFKGRVDAYVNADPRTEEEIRNGLKGFFDDFYQFGFENAGIIKFIMAPSNKQLQDVCNKYFFSMFSVNSDFTYKIISRMATYNHGQSTENLQVRYVLLFSSLALPLLFQLDLFEANNGKQMFPLQEPSFKENYINQLTKLVLGV